MTVAKDNLKQKQLEKKAIEKENDATLKTLEKSTEKISK